MAGGARFGAVDDALAPIFERLRGRLTAAPGPLVALGARRDGSGWSVLLLRGGEELAVLDAAAARDLAAEILTMADVIEGKRW